MNRIHLSEKDQVYFLHIPKTAGSSLMEFLHHYFPEEAVAHFQPPDLVQSPDILRARRLIVGHLYNTVHHYLDRGPVYLTMLRNPVAQVLSHIRHIQRHPGHRLHEKLSSRSMSEILVDRDLEPLITNYQLRNLLINGDPGQFTGNIGFEMLGAGGDFRKLVHLNAAKSLLDEFAFVGITERFEESVELLAYTLHWPLRHSTSRRNSDPSPFDAGQLSAQALAVLYERTELDRQLYEYAVELLEERRKRMMMELLQADHMRIHFQKDDLGKEQ